MNHQIRTNSTMHISQLIASALLPLNVPHGTTIPPADGTILATSQKHSGFQVEEGDPVRSTERVPYSSSHYLVREQSASSNASCCPGTTGAAPEVAAA